MVLIVPDEFKCFSTEHINGLETVPVSQYYGYNELDKRYFGKDASPLDVYDEGKGEIWDKSHTGYFADQKKNDVNGFWDDLDNSHVGKEKGDKRNRGMKSNRERLRGLPGSGKFIDCITPYKPIFGCGPGRIFHQGVQNCRMIKSNFKCRCYTTYITTTLIATTTTPILTTPTPIATSTTPIVTTTTPIASTTTPILNTPTPIATTTTSIVTTTTPIVTTTIPILTTSTPIATTTTLIATTTTPIATITTPIVTGITQFHFSSGCADLTTLF
ncbi:unnamed protein product [Gordionus sp. m RMFG-2023]